MESKKQTAIEWLDEQIQERVIAQDIIAKKMIIEISMEDYINLKKQAKAMEKEQIEDAFHDGKWDWDNHIKNGTGSMDLAQYYKETYGK